MFKTPVLWMALTIIAALVVIAVIGDTLLGCQLSDNITQADNSTALGYTTSDGITRMVE